MPDPAVRVGDGVGASHDVALSALLPLLGVSGNSVVHRVSVVVPRHRGGLLDDGANDCRRRDNRGGHIVYEGCVVHEGCVVDRDWGGAVNCDGHDGGGGSPDEGVSRSLVGDGGVGVRNGGGGRQRHGPHLLHVLHVVRHRLGVSDRVHDGVRDGANAGDGGEGLVGVHGGRGVGRVGGGHWDGGGGHGPDHGRGGGVGVVMVDDGGWQGSQPLKHRAADAGDAGEHLRCRDGQGGREEEDEEEGLKRGVRLRGPT